MKNPPVILSLIYQNRIDKLCSTLNKTCDFKYFVCYIVFNNGQTFVLSNMFHMLLSYYVDDLYKEDFNFSREVTSDVTHYLCDRSASITKNFAEILEEKFNIFRAYYIVRNSPECQFIFGAIKDKKFTDHERIYKTTHNKFENFCSNFVDETIDIIKQYNPTYSSSIILNDSSYRKAVIKSDFNQDDKLTMREIDCLYWAAHGKTSEDTASILGIGKTTVDSYRNEIKRKLNATNMAQAVFEGMRKGYIGAFGKSWKRKDAVSINGILISRDMQDAERQIKYSNLWLLNKQSFH